MTRSTSIREFSRFLCVRPYLVLDVHVRKLREADLIVKMKKKVVSLDKQMSKRHLRCPGYVTLVEIASGTNDKNSENDP